MKKIFLFLMFATAGFADQLILENQTPHPANQSKMAIQWASSAKEVQEQNQASMQGRPLNSKTLQRVKSPGKLKLNIPKKAEYFRIVVWMKGEDTPEFLTNWVDVEPNKTYELKADHLTPAVLMFGMGC